MIKQTTIDLLDNTVDIIDVAEMYVELKKAGSVFKGLSPFRDEKTPSFVVSPSKQIWHDFGSGQGGRAINLVMEIEGLNFPEAVEKLCALNNITVEYDEGTQEKKISSKMLEAYSLWCEENLQKNHDALKYLKDRGVSDASISKFEIGYSPSSSEVVDFIQKNLYSTQEAIDLGIIDSGENGLYGRFIKRLMFPIRDHTGKMCGFSGRTLDNHPAKYVNTKDTALFKKSNLMYGFNFAKEVISKKNFFVLSEGQMDVVMQHQVGLKYSFASMGTALTEGHVKILSRFAKKGIIAYDGDNAGVKAAFKAAELLIRSMIDARVVIFDDGEDPADLVASGRAQELVMKMKNGIPAIKFCVDRILLPYDLSNPFQKSVAFEEIQKFAGKMQPMVQASIMQEASPSLGVIESVDPERAESYHRPNRSPMESRERELIKAVLISGKDDDLKLLSSITKCFYLKDAMDALMSGDVGNNLLTEILLDEHTIASAHLEEDTRLFKIWCMKRFLGGIRSSKNMSTQDKIEKMREAQSKILELEDEARRAHGDRK